MHAFWCHNKLVAFLLLLNEDNQWSENETPRGRIKCKAHLKQYSFCFFQRGVDASVGRCCHDLHHAEVWFYFSSSAGRRTYKAKVTERVWSLCTSFGVSTF